MIQKYEPRAQMYVDDDDDEEGGGGGGGGAGGSDENVREKLAQWCRMLCKRSHPTQYPLSPRANSLDRTHLSWPAASQSGTLCAERY